MDAITGNTLLLSMILMAHTCTEVLNWSDRTILEYNLNAHGYRVVTSCNEKVIAYGYK